MSQGLVQTPQGLVQTPQGLVQNPQGLVQTPQGLVQNPQGLVQNPQGLVQNPQGLVQNPQGLVQKPQGLVQTTQRLVQTGQLVQTPQGILQIGPQGILQAAPQVLLQGTVCHGSKGTSRLRTSTAGPVDKMLRDPRRHYCKACPAHYSRKDELKYHEDYNCLRPLPDFICEVCEKGYFSDTTLMEHYFKVHLKQFLYFCKKCNQGFSHKSYRSSHKNACPNKDQDDVYTGMVDVDPELKKKF